MRWGRRKKPKRRGYVRPSRARPKTGWTLRELAALTGIAGRTIRLYLEQGLMPRPPFLGSATRYQLKHLEHLVAIRRLRATEHLDLAAIRTRLQGLSAPELAAFARTNVPAGPLADALGIPGGTVASATPNANTAPVKLSPQLPRWVRLELALGLELHIREDASASVIELSRRVYELCTADAKRAETPPTPTSTSTS